ncbi:hypothetical protein ACH4UM_15360 [Streptomyces sp. NPDC020801]|uniref:hypothetical protein n=1 Tax=Streptomyces sp. NPDC020801 TaxID=3365093 RepID=UPI00378FE42E
MCPAEAGKAQCPIKPHTMGHGIHLPLVDPEPSRVGPLKVCRRRTITISPETGAKHWQALEHGGPEWQKVRKIKKWLDTLSLGGERPRRRTHHRRRTKEPETWTPTGHLAPAAQPDRPRVTTRHHPYQNAWTRP